MIRIACVLTLVLSSLGTASAQELPNIVLILADDLGSGDLGCYNADSKIPTPNLDRLAREGLRLTDAHSPSGVCSPTRYGLLTGRYAWRTRLSRGVLWGYSPSLIERGRTTVASLLLENGYATACFGKWHLGFGTEDPVDYGKPLRPGPLDFGFGTFLGIPASLDMTPYVYVGGDRPVALPTTEMTGSSQRRQGGGGFWRRGAAAPGFKHVDVMPTLTKAVVQFVEERAKDESGAPFFVYFPLTAPHTPWLPTPEFRKKSGAGYYGDFAAQVDHSIGEVLEALDRLSLTENTLVFVTSDNGAHWTPADIERYGHLANMNYRGQKADIWEGGHRVPFLARWPGRIEPGSVNAETVCLTDFLATFAAIVGTKLPPGAGEDSYDVLPVLLGEDLERPLREATVLHSFDGMYAIRQGAWKLIFGRGSGGFSEPQRTEPKAGEPIGQLYRLDEDLGETKNLFLEHPEVVKRLQELFEQYRSQGFSRPGGGE